MDLLFFVANPYILFIQYIYVNELITTYAIHYIECKTHGIVIRIYKLNLKKEVSREFYMFHSIIFCQQNRELSIRRTLL
jgi:intergrase/recombinase